MEHLAPLIDVRPLSKRALILKIAGIMTDMTNNQKGLATR
jgi:hypothetical protein